MVRIGDDLTERPLLDMRCYRTQAQSAQAATGRAVLFFGWAYLPESWLYSMGITYYPSRYWAVAFPAYAMMLIVFICLAYTSLNYIATIPPDSWNSLCDEFTRAPTMFSMGDASGKERPIDPISDIPITDVNYMMFGS
ncbi:hypothetical protein L7F22_027047 [Adiantum nelumboides]|nr:hypothetical protein [Adiantum nelumboides]